MFSKTAHGIRVPGLSLEYEHTNSEPNCNGETITWYLESPRRQNSGNVWEGVSRLDWGWKTHPKCSGPILCPEVPVGGAGRRGGGRKKPGHRYSSLSTPDCRCDDSSCLMLLLPWLSSRMDCVLILSQYKLFLSWIAPIICVLTAIRKEPSMLCYSNLYFCGKGRWQSWWVLPKSLCQGQCGLRKASNPNRAAFLFCVALLSREVAFMH